MTYSHEVEHMCVVKKGPNHGPAPIPEEGKWVKIQGWDGVESAKSEILAGIQRFNSTSKKPMF